MKKLLAIGLIFLSLNAFSFQVHDHARIAISFTEIQFKEYLKGLHGIKIKWVGEVVEVKKVPLRSIYTIIVDFPGTSIDVHIIGVKRNVAMSIRKYDLKGNCLPIHFSGKIKEQGVWSSLLNNLPLKTLPGRKDIVVHDAIIRQNF